MITVFLQNNHSITLDTIDRAVSVLGTHPKNLQTSILKVDISEDLHKTPYSLWKFGNLDFVKTRGKLFSYSQGLCLMNNFKPSSLFPQFHKAHHQQLFYKILSWFFHRTLSK